MTPPNLDRLTTNKLIPAYERFGFQLLSQLAKQDRDKNVFISPLSVAIALAMTYNGAQGTTKQAIAQVLGFDNLNLQDIQAINAANQSLLSMGDNLDAQIQLAFANSLWLRQGISLNDDFVQQLQDFFQSQVASLDFSDPDAATTINRWVAEKTQGKIQNLVTPDLIRAAILLLINAIYFKGRWTRRFNKASTAKQPFHAPGSRCKHPMMTQSGRYRYCETDLFQAVSLPYGEGYVSLYVFLPKPSSSLAEFQTQLTSDNWQRWMVQFCETTGEIGLPRFTVEYEQSLNDALIGLGMGEAFSEQANFASMGAGPLTISDVIHKAVIEVNEAGTKAAAATAVIMTRSAAPMSPFKMIVDRPFFHAIRDDRTGALLFMGFVLNPAAK